MIFIREFAEFNAEPTKFIISTLENAIALKDTTLFWELALNAYLGKPMTLILRLVPLPLAKE